MGDIRIFKHKETERIEKINNDILVSVLKREGYEEVIEEEKDPKKGK